MLLLEKVYLHFNKMKKEITTIYFVLLLVLSNKVLSQDLSNSKLSEPQRSDNPVQWESDSRKFTAETVSSRVLDSISSKVEKYLESVLLQEVDDRKINLDYEFISGYITLARIAFIQKYFSKALAYIKAAEKLDHEQSDSRIFFLEGRIWHSLKKYKDAEEDYFKAWRQGVDVAEDSLKHLFEYQNGNLSGFSLYTKMLADDLLKQAPLFETLSIDNKAIKFEDYRRKIVVLDFWFIGCPGCEIEKDALTRIAKKYAGTDVVFISLSKDNENRLRSYLMTHPSNWICIPGASSIAEKYNVYGYPTHIIIDKEGRIDSKIIGGYDKIDEELARYIERCRALSE